MSFIPYKGRREMLNKEVTAVGCCGIGNGVEVKGILIEIVPNTIVNVEQLNKHFMPYMVNPQTLKLV